MKNVFFSEKRFLPSKNAPAACSQRKTNIFFWKQVFGPKKEMAMGLGVGDFYDDGYPDVVIGTGDPAFVAADVFFCKPSSHFCCWTLWIARTPWRFSLPQKCVRTTTMSTHEHVSEWRAESKHFLHQKPNHFQQNSSLRKFTPTRQRKTYGKES